MGFRVFEGIVLLTIDLIISFRSIYKLLGLIRIFVPADFKNYLCFVGYWPY